MADLLPEEVWFFLGVGLLLLAIAAPIVYFASKQRGGEAEDAVRARVEDFAAALAKGKGEAACGMLAEAAAEQLARRVGRGIADVPDGARACEEAVREAAASRSVPQREALSNIEVLDVDYEDEWSDPLGDIPSEYEGASATARLEGGVVELSTESAYTDDADNWTIDSTDPIFRLLSQGRCCDDPDATAHRTNTVG